MSIRNFTGLDFPSVPAVVNQFPSTVIVAMNITNADVSQDTQYVFSAYDGNSGGENGFRRMYAAYGYAYAGEKGANSSDPIGDQLINTDFQFGYFNADRHNVWLWWSFQITSLSERVFRIEDTKWNSTGTFAGAPSFTSTALGEGFDSSTLLAEAHFLNGTISDEQWSAIRSGNLDPATMAGYVDGFSFKDSLTSRKGILSISARNSPTFDARHPGVGTAPAPSPSDQVLFAGMCL